MEGKMNLVPVTSKALMPVRGHIQYLTQDQINSLTAVYQQFFDQSPTPKQYAKRGKHWLTFLVLRSTGARLMEALSLNPGTDVDYRNSELKLLTLKQKRATDREGKYKRHRAPSRIVPVASNIVSEISNYRVQVSQYIERGEVSKGEINPFRLNPATVRKTFYRLAKQAGIPQDLGHPHILRHSYCIELLRAGVPVTVVQDLVGHSSLNTTAIYLRMPGHEAKQILKDRGLI
jgi:molybdate transport system regulatory protein